MKIPAAVVTMRSRILFRYNDVPQIHEIDLLYPDDSGRHRRKLSVLTHMGTALLGLHEGQAMPFEESDGSMHRVFVVKVRFQPEALGMYWL
jgi:regulator of nucleoside diphosphate kinase